MVSFTKVSKSFGDEVIFQDLNFVVHPGEFVYLVGKSGTGKTTLMRMLTQQVIPDSGEIQLDGITIGTLDRKGVETIRRKIGVIYQDYKLLSQRTIAENIALGLEIIGKEKEEIDSRVADLLTLVGLPSKASNFPTQLSGGEAQRVCIARALATAPRFLFADEPTGNLDEHTAIAIVRLLEKIQELGTTVLMATHNQSLLANSKKRILYLENGTAVEKKHDGKKEKTKL